MAVYTGNRLPRGSRVYALHDVTVDRCDGLVVGVDIDEPESPGD